MKIAIVINVVSQVCSKSSANYLERGRKREKLRDSVITQYVEVIFLMSQYKSMLVDAAMLS